MASPAQPYDRAAARYDHRWAEYVRWTLDLLDSSARITPAERVLDVGCGTGTFVRRLVDRNPDQQGVGVDVSGGMLAEARRKVVRAPNVRFVQASAEALPFEASAFDVVVTASALHYAARPDAVLAEAARVLRPGGRLVVVDWDRGRPWMAGLDLVLRLFDAAHARTLTADEIERAAAGAGLDVQRVERVRRGAWGLAVVAATKPTVSPTASP